MPYQAAGFMKLTFEDPVGKKSSFGPKPASGIGFRGNGREDGNYYSGLKACSEIWEFPTSGGQCCLSL